jgi:hypothetical protein
VPEPKFYRIVMTVEVPDDYDFYDPDDTDMIGRRAEQAINTNTGMTAWLHTVDKVADPDGRAPL